MSYRRLLVPVDGSELTDKAIHASITLARQLGAAITAFVAEPMPPLPSSPRTKALLDQAMAQHDAEVHAHAQPLLERFEAAAAEAGVPFKGVYDQVPSIDKAIVAAAEAQGCDMIVMVTHGRGKFGEFLFGSHTKSVLASSKLPLLVVH